jgi:hypothetical protein
VIQSPIYHETPGLGHTGPDPAIAAEVQFASPELDARIGLVLAEAHGFVAPGLAALLERHVLDLTPPFKRRHQHKQRSPDGLLTRAQAAAKLNCSLRTLDGHVASGALRYVAIGHGKKRPRRMFTDADLNAFIANQTRKDVPCPSTAAPARRSGSTIFGGEVIAFTGVPRPRPGGKPKK